MKTTEAITGKLVALYPGKTVTHIKNFAIADGEESLMFGVKVRVDVYGNNVDWCYI